MLCYEANFFFAVLLVDERIIKWDVFYEIKDKVYVFLPFTE